MQTTPAQRKKVRPTPHPTGKYVTQPLALFQPKLGRKGQILARAQTRKQRTAGKPQTLNRGTLAANEPDSAPWLTDFDPKIAEPNRDTSLNPKNTATLNRRMEDHLSTTCLCTVHGCSFAGVVFAFAAVCDASKTDGGN